MTTLSVRIRQARLGAKLSQAELARRIGVKRGAVTQWEQPQGTHPSIAHLIQIALETGTRFEWLATGRDCASSSDDVVPALIIEDLARDEHESRALTLLRRLPSSKRRIALEILDVLAR